jgi:hypothetical protein
VTLDEDGIEDQAPPLFAEDVRSIIRSGTGDEALQSWMMDAKFGPDGALYMTDYGGGFFSLTNNQKLIRITYDGGPATPEPAISSTAVQNKPLTIAFTGARSGGVSYEWDFGDGNSSDEANPRHTYAAAGTYTATLTLSYGVDGALTETNTVVVVAPVVYPDVLVFEYGPSLGCIGDFLVCYSEELGETPVPVSDGFWQELDERYWGLEFTVTSDSLLNDTDCTAYDADGEPISVDLNGGAGPCAGRLPEGTAALFLYNYLEPSSSLRLEFFLPE